MCFIVQLSSCFFRVLSGSGQMILYHSLKRLVNIIFIIFSLSFRRSLSDSYHNIANPLSLVNGKNEKKSRFFAACFPVFSDHKMLCFL